MKKKILLFKFDYFIIFSFKNILISIWKHSEDSEFLP